MDHPQLRSYVNRFESVLAPLLPLRMDRRVPWITGGRGSVNHVYEAFDFTPAAPLAPDRQQEELAYTLLNYSSVELQFFKTPIAPKDHPQISGDWSSGVKPDLKLSVTSEFEARSFSKHVVEYIVNSKQFRLYALGLMSDPRYWEASGKVVGIPDLLGAQMFVRLHSIMVSGNPAIDEYLKQIRGGLEVDTLIVSLSSGREFWFTRAQLQSI